MQSTFRTVNFPPERNNRSGLDYGESAALQPTASQIHTVYPLSTSPWKSSVLPLSSSLAAGDTWRKRVALSLYKKTKNAAGFANQKFVLRYTNEVSDRPAANHHQLVSSGISSLASQYDEKGQLDGSRRTQTSQVSFVTQPFSS